MASDEECWDEWSEPAGADARADARAEALAEARAARCIDDPEDWQDMWSEELVAMWHAVIDKRDEMGAAVLDRCSIADFTQFCFEHSSGLKSKHA